MNKIIKVTRKQLQETEGAAFEYLDDNNDVPYGNNSTISADGKKDDDEYGEPVIGDKVGNTMTIQNYNRFYHTYGGYTRPTTIREKDENQDNVDDFYNNDELDMISDGNEDNNLIKMPNSAEMKVEQLISVIEKLQPKQQAMIINKLVETLNIENIPSSWKKELMFKIMNKK